MVLLTIKVAQRSTNYHCNQPAEQKNIASHFEKSTVDGQLDCRGRHLSCVHALVDLVMCSLARICFASVEVMGPGLLGEKGTRNTKTI